MNVEGKSRSRKHGDDQPRWKIGTYAVCDCEQQGETLGPPSIACFDENRQGRIVNTCGQRRKKGSFRSREKGRKREEKETRWSEGALCECEEHGRAVPPPTRLACFQGQRRGRIVNIFGQRRNQPDLRDKEIGEERLKRGCSTTFQLNCPGQPGEVGPGQPGEEVIEEHQGRKKSKRGNRDRRRVGEQRRRRKESRGRLERSRCKRICAKNNLGIDNKWGEGRDPRFGPLFDII